MSQSTVRLLGVVVSLGLLGSCGSPSQGEDPPMVPPRQQEATLARDVFVTRSGNQFMLDSKPFRHVGANVPELVYQPQNEVVAELDYLEAAGVRQVRVFLPNNNCTTDQTIARLRYVLDRALERDIRVTVALAHNYYQDVWGHDQRACTPGGTIKHVIRGDEGYYVARAGEGPEVNDCPNKSGVNTVCMLSDEWIDWAYQINYKPYVTAVVSAFRDHRGVFAWDIANEMNSAQTGNSYMQQATIRFYQNMAAAIKASDPNHLVTTGLISSHWAGLFTDADKKAVYNNVNIDYVTVHTYDNDFAKLHQDDDIARANSSGYYNRPVVVEEFGKSLSAHGNNMVGVRDAVTAFYDKHYNPVDSFNVDAIVPWGVSAYESYDDGNASTDHTPRQQQLISGDSGVMRWYMWHWLTWAGELDRLNGGGTEPTKLVQSVWRGDVEYQRRVPIDASGSPNFGAARGWVAVRKHYDLQGSGPVQAYNVSLYPNRVLQESIWRGDVGYYRDIPINPGGMPNWKAASIWRSVGLSGLPGTGSYQAQDDFVYPNNQMLMQSIWRSDVGYYREVPLLNGTPNWNSAGSWRVSGSISSMPGSGSMQAQDDVIYPNKQTMMQSIWRGDQGFYRTVPMDASGRPNWSAASGWSAPIGSHTMPGYGSGALLGQANYCTSLLR